MIVSKTTSYALKTLSFMARDPQKIFSAICLFEALDIPQPYLKRLLTDLSKKGFIKSHKGRSGGFYFSRDINNIYVSEIIEAVEGMDSFNSCIFGNSLCSPDNVCPMHDNWEKMKDQLHSTLTTTSLGDLTNK